MNTEGSRLNEWVIRRIKTQYPDDVGLLLGHTTLKLAQDRHDASFSFFVPVTSRGKQLAVTFMIRGIGYDLFPISWERLERTAALEEYNTTCLADAEILYYRQEADKQRFLALQAKLRDNLRNPPFLLEKALAKLNIAQEIYQSMLFEDALYKIRKAAGFILDYLSIAVACVNQTYFQYGQEEQIPDLQKMKNLPRDFIGLYQDVVAARSAADLKKLCYEIITETRRFLIARKGQAAQTAHKRDFSALANWYQELCYTWRRVYHWCDQKDAVRSFIWGCFLQSELDVVAAEFGLGEMDLLGAFADDNLGAFQQRAEKLEQQIVSALIEHGVSLNAYDSVDTFLAQNA
jgi:hypothetical protein